MKKTLIKSQFIVVLFFLITGLLILLGTNVHGQVITTYAGDGFNAGYNTGGYSGNGGLATAAELDQAVSMALDDSGNLYLSDSHNNVIRKVEASTGIITTIVGNGYDAGTNYGGYSGDGGAATSAELNDPWGIAIDDSGNIYIADYANFRIRKVTMSTGIITTIAGNGTQGYSGDNMSATNAELNYAEDVALDDSGNIYITDDSNNRIRKVNKSTGIITTIAGNGTQGFFGNGGQATDAELHLPSGVLVDDSGNVYIADQWNNEVRILSQKTGIINAYAGNGTGAGGLFSGNFSGDGGQATTAELNFPTEIGMDDSGNIYIADWANQRIRKVTAKTGIITTVAGNGYNQGNQEGGYNSDGILSTQAELNAPSGVVTDACGDIYIADQYNDRIRKVSVSADSIKIFPIAPIICSGSSDTLTASGADNYTWSPSTGLSSTTGAVVIANPTINTTYIITGTGICSGIATPDTVVVSVTASPSLTVLQQPSTPVCNGQNVTLSISGSGSSFTWSPSIGLSATSGNSVVATPSVTTTYTVNGTSGGCTSTGMDTINIVPAPSLIIKPQDTTICNGSSVTLFAPASGSGYSWSPPATLSSAAADSVIATPTVQTTYTVTGTDSVGCTASGTDIVYVNVGFNKPIIIDTDNLITSTATQGNQWYKDGHAISGATGESYTATDTGCYYDVATNIANGCSSISNTLCIDKLAGINLLTINPNLLSIYPNPTGGEIFVNISSSVADVKDWNLQITDVLGRTVYIKTSLNYKNDIDLSDLPGGVYFIIVVDKATRVVFPIIRQNY